MMKKSSNNKFYVFISLVVGMIIPLMIFLFFSNLNEDKLTLPGAVKISNQPLPKSELCEIKENINFSEKIQKGNVLLIFLSSDCNACKKDVEIISKIYPQMSPNLQVFGVSIESSDKILNFIIEKNINFPILIDKRAELFTKLKVNYFPTKYLIQDGVIMKTIFGSFQNEESMLEDLQIGD